MHADVRTGLFLWLASLGCIACGHPPIHAKSLPNPVLVGPVRELPARPGGQPNARADRPRERPVPDEGVMTFTSSRDIQTVSLGSGTQTTERWTVPGAFEAELVKTAHGDPDALHSVRSIRCGTGLLFFFVLVVSTEQCTLTTTTTHPRGQQHPAP